jgi:hypothetical protein
MSIDGKLLEVEIICKQMDKSNWNDLNFFLVTHNRWIRMYYGSLEINEQFTDYTLIRDLKLSRGAILDVFSKIEFIVDKILEAMLLGLYSPNSRMFEEMLESIDLFSRLKLLESWGLVNKKTDDEFLSLVYQLKQVRNGLTHRWKESEVTYKGRKLTEQRGHPEHQSGFDLMKEDLEKVWIKILELYMNEQNTKIDDLINMLKQIPPKMQ